MASLCKINVIVYWNKSSVDITPLQQNLPAFFCQYLLWLHICRPVSGKDLELVVLHKNILASNIFNTGTIGVLFTSNYHHQKSWRQTGWNWSHDRQYKHMQHQSSLLIRNVFLTSNTQRQIPAQHTLQETQLMLTNPRDTFIGHWKWYHSTDWYVYRSVKVTKHGTIQYVGYSLLLVCYSNFIPKTSGFSDIRIHKCRKSRSLKVVPHDRLPMVSY